MENRGLFTPNNDIHDHNTTQSGFSPAYHTFVNSPEDVLRR